MSDPTTNEQLPELEADQRVAVRSTADSEFAGLRARVVYAPDENNSTAILHIEYPPHPLDGWTVTLPPEDIVVSGKLVDPRYVLGVSEIDDDMTDEEWATAYGPSDELLARWNAESLTGGVSAGAQHNASADGVRVIAVYVEDHQSDEYARMFECFFPDGTVDYVADDEIELDDDLAADDVSDDYRNDPAACIADEVHLKSTDDDGFCNACGHQQTDDENESDHA